MSKNTVLSPAAAEQIGQGSFDLEQATGAVAVENSVESSPPMDVLDDTANFVEVDILPRIEQLEKRETLLGLYEEYVTLSRFLRITQRGHELRPKIAKEPDTKAHPKGLQGRRDDALAERRKLQNVDIRIAFANLHGYKTEVIKGKAEVTEEKPGRDFEQELTSSRMYYINGSDVAGGNASRGRRIAKLRRQTDRANTQAELKELRKQHVGQRALHQAA
jgi:hypothetical protein